MREEVWARYQRSAGETVLGAIPFRGVNMRLLLILLLCFALTMYGGTLAAGPVMISSATTTPVAYNCSVSTLRLVNVSSSSATVTVTDRSTMCNSGPCHLVPPNLVIPAGVIYELFYPDGYQASGGVVWSASTNNAVEGTIVIK